MRRQASLFELEVSPRDVACIRFTARVKVDGVIALKYTYRLSLDLTPCNAFRDVVVTNPSAFARIFGWRNLSHHEANALKILFLEKEAAFLVAEADAVHVVAAARARQFTRISNVLAIRHALAIRPYVDDLLARRLMSFELCGDVGTFAPHHWTSAAGETCGILPCHLID